MLAVAIILIFVLYLIFFMPRESKVAAAEEDIQAIRQNPQMRKLWSLAQGAMKERKTLKAEKALLTILKFDEKNAAAYNRLGILYARDKKYDDAVECFEIAQSLDNNASSLHNVGLIYLETENYEKAAMAFAQAIEMEGDMPARYIAYAKAAEKIGERKKAIDALETAYSLDNSTATLRHLLGIYERAEDEENTEVTKARIEEALEEKRAEALLKTKKPKAKLRKKIVKPKNTRKVI